jgi:hypothetical protein
LYIKPAAITYDVPIRKLASSPIPPVDVDRSCNIFFINSIITPVTGPNANAPISAGKSDRSIRANDGLKGTGNSKNANTYDIAASRAVIVIVLVETRFSLVLIVAVLLLINLLFVRYA